MDLLNVPSHRGADPRIGRIIDSNPHGPGDVNGARFTGSHQLQASPSGQTRYDPFACMQDAVPVPQVVGRRRVIGELQARIGDPPEVLLDERLQKGGRR